MQGVQTKDFSVGFSLFAVLQLQLFRGQSYEVKCGLKEY